MKFCGFELALSYRLPNGSHMPVSHLGQTSAVKLWLFKQISVPLFVRSYCCMYSESENNVDGRKPLEVTNPTPHSQQG